MSDLNLPGAKMLEPGPRNTPEQQHAAALAICARATDVDDARELLGMLGLLERIPLS